MTTNIRLGQLQDGASRLWAMTRTCGERACSSLYKYVTVETPKADAAYFHQMPSGERVELTDGKTRDLAVRIETLEREKTRWKNVANLGCGTTAVVPFAVVEGTPYRLLAAVFAGGVFKGNQLIRKQIDQRYDSQITALRQQIAQQLEAGSQKKAE